jgi:hypothetical protein
MQRYMIVLVYLGESVYKILRSWGDVLSFYILLFGDVMQFCNQKDKGTESNFVKI